MTQLFPVANLRDRYGIGKQAEINRRKHLNIKPTKVDGTFYVTENQLKLLDALHHWLTKEGRRMADFDPDSMVDSLEPSGGLTKSSSTEATPPDYQEATLIETQELNPEWGPLIELLAEKLSPARSPIQNWRELEEACEKGWLLTTKQVHELAGSKPHGKEWERGAFIFSRAGKIGNQVAWQVDKKI